MAASATSTSRFGVTLQGFHQVIALSQASINDILSHHFETLGSEAHRFDDYSDKNGHGIRDAILKASTVHLIEEGDADAALFFVNFKSGTYCWKETSRARIDFNVPKHQRHSPHAQPRELDLEGWSLAYKAKFSVKRKDGTPQEFGDKIKHSGMYTVDQVLIDFRSPGVGSLDWQSSITPGLASLEGRSASRVKLYFENHLEAVRKRPDSERLLGVVVRLDEKQDLASTYSQDPSFPPTSMRPQVMLHRPDGDMNRRSPKNGLNAFLFTEMTQSAPMPDKKIEWTGGFFYGSFGGTLAMSKHIFVDTFLARNLKVLVVDARNLANSICSNLPITRNLDETWLLDGDREPLDGLAPTLSGLGLKYQGHDSMKTREHTHQLHWSSEMFKNLPFGVEIGTSKWLDWSEKVANVTCECKETSWADVETISVTVKPKAESGTVEISSGISMTAKWRICATALGRKLIETGYDITATADWTAQIDLSSVEDGGELFATVSVPVVNTLPRVTNLASTALDDLPVLGKLVSDRLKEADTFVSELDSMVRKTIREATGTERLRTLVEALLNEQARFIFPGGGTFDMKSPVFSDSGDLLIGLTYRTE
ncbi:hypothetical protein QBC40DRAFT_295913 [Triangularia verruculosa]|uniref:Uncharacterized protein n=1 Tax=Triangularia verruculosa TaxID=2587418 RepID=A0AAN6XNU7_9PEZI|nr:hypothetical protein QBC40DRAFT_295913 [Triangularia verruculosa]